MESEEAGSDLKVSKHVYHFIVEAQFWMLHCKLWEVSVIYICHIRLQTSTCNVYHQYCYVKQSDKLQSYSINALVW